METEIQEVGSENLSKIQKIEQSLENLNTLTRNFRIFADRIFLPDQSLIDNNVPDPGEEQPPTLIDNNVPDPGEEQPPNLRSILQLIERLPEDIDENVDLLSMLLKDLHEALLT